MTRAHPELSDHDGEVDRASVPHHQLLVWWASYQTSPPTPAVWQS